MFNYAFGLKRLLVEIRRIANALEVIALHFASVDGRMWQPNQRMPKAGSSRGDESEVLHTLDEDMLVRQLKDRQQLEAGWEKE